jgi:hypothetical protein
MRPVHRRAHRLQVCSFSCAQCDATAYLCALCVEALWNRTGAMTLDPVAPVMTTLGFRRAQLRTHAAARSSPRASGPSALPQLTGWVNILQALLLPDPGEEWEHRWSTRGERGCPPTTPRFVRGRRLVKPFSMELKPFGLIRMLQERISVSSRSLKNERLTAGSTHWT